jgi:hypothetical protein
MQFPPEEKGFACQAWQVFIGLNWPALAQPRGAPDDKALFGRPGTTVWETYKTAEQVFLPNGQHPGTWLAAPRVSPVESTTFASLIADGRMRHLTVESKVSREVLANVLRHAATAGDTLDTITQAGGGVLYDLRKNPVFYEVAINQGHYDYIVDNNLYSIGGQAAFGRTIHLPLGDGERKGAIAVKAAWKILSAAEARSGRFHTSRALLRGSQRPVTVGLVGFHVFQPLPGLWQGNWATFAQIDNAPVEGQPIKGPYSFFNPGCVSCSVNIKNQNPGQVKQMFPDHDAAAEINDFMRQAIKKYNARAPWQYYRLVAVQWPMSAEQVSTLPPPARAPLPLGQPNKTEAFNAVLETFAQSNGVSCLRCHARATTTAGYASYYSYVFGRAQ